MAQVEAAQPQMPDVGATGRSKTVSENRFFFLMAVVCALLIFLGFTPSYYLKNVINAPPPLSPMTHIHGFVFTAWTLLFVLQTWLIDRGNKALHRRLGVVGAVLFGIVFTVGIATAINAARLGHTPPGSPPALIFLATPLFAMSGVLVLVLAALWNRARRDAHMRYMIAGLIAMTPPATHRLAMAAGFFSHALWVSFMAMDLLLLVALAYDNRIRAQVHRAFLWSAGVFVAVQGGIAWAYASPAWPPIAHWLIQE
jgi:hypothetical protein